MNTRSSRIRRRFIIPFAAALIVCCAVQPVAAQKLEGELPRPSDEQVTIGLDDLENVHWAIRLGLRVAQVEHAFPLVDRVVLVPDGATYLDELSKWSTSGRWPVLFEDDRYAPMFIRRFAPKQVIRRSSVGELPDRRAAREIAMNDVIVRTWGGDPSQHTWRQCFSVQRYTPPGVVITSADDPAWTAAVALAAGRGQPLAWLNDKFRRVDAGFSAEEAARLATTVEGLVSQFGYPYQQLGDDIDAVTICRNLPHKVTVPRPAGEVPARPDLKIEGPEALTDFLGRKLDNNRYAFTGLIFGNETRCAYVAMCSLFLDRRDAWLFNTYPDEGGWSLYRVNDVAVVLSEWGYGTVPFNEERTSEVAWKRMLPGGVNFDMLFMNSRGSASSFALHEDDRGTAYDVPVLNIPAAVHFTHSWSMKAPGDPGTIGGQWIDHGAYAYVGSLHEPYLTAFVPPAMLAERLTRWVPLLVAARHWDDAPAPFRGPWKVNTYGDPLMLCAPPQRMKLERKEPTAVEGADLRAHAKDLLRETKTDETGEVYDRAMRTLDLLGEDSIVIQLWNLAETQGVAPQCASAALPALFRQRDVDGFLRAWSVVGDPPDWKRDMAWHLLEPLVRSSQGAEILLALQGAVREPRPERDIERLAPLLNTRFGPDHLISWITVEADRAKKNRSKQQILKLIGKYQKPDRMAP